MSGDGKTKETAFEVICDREEYAMMSALGLSSFGPSVIVVPLQDGPHRYEKRQVRDPATGKDRIVFFNFGCPACAGARTSMKSGDQAGSMVLRGNEPRPFFLLVV
jgi:hypothetical protein